MLSWVGQSITTKGKEFPTHNGRPMLHEFMYVLTNVQWGIGQKKKAFWIVVDMHYATNKLASCWKDLLGVSKSNGAIWRCASPCLWVAMSILRLGQEWVNIWRHHSWYFAILFQKVAKPLAHKHCWLLFQDHLRFAAVFMAMGSKCKTACVDVSDMPIDRREGKHLNWTTTTSNEH